MTKYYQHAINVAHQAINEHDYDATIRECKFSIDVAAASLARVS